MTRWNCSPPGSSVHGQGCWSGLPCPPPGDLRNPGIEASCFMSPALAGWFFTTITTWETTHWRRWNRPNRTRVVQAKDSAWANTLRSSNGPAEVLILRCHPCLELLRGPFPYFCFSFFASLSLLTYKLSEKGSHCSESLSFLLNRVLEPGPLTA